MNIDKLSDIIDSLSDGKGMLALSKLQSNNLLQIMLQNKGERKYSITEELFFYLLLNHEYFLLKYKEAYQAMYPNIEEELFPLYSHIKRPTL